MLVSRVFRVLSHIKIIKNGRHARSAWRPHGRYDVLSIPSDVCYDRTNSLHITSKRYLARHTKLFIHVHRYQYVGTCNPFMNGISASTKQYHKNTGSRFNVKVHTAQL